MAVGEKTGGIKLESERCTGCRICEQVCVFFREQEFNPRRARIRVLCDEKEGVYTPLLCNQCGDCISACSLEALSWDDEAGVVRVDAERCNGCGLCIEACPSDAVFLDPVTGTANICDLCGGDPECVKWCTERALLYEPAA
jgi:Fe-S-cluster-containing hydrogenase component 2